jgi:endonuclease/exonuclease/phosphatase family metal-dependent hydrolase
VVAPIVPTSDAENEPASTVDKLGDTEAHLDTDGLLAPSPSELSDRQGVPQPVRNGIRIATWNTTALFGIPTAAAGDRIRRRLRILRQLLADTDVLCLQEVHGRQADLEALRTEILEFSFFGSFCSSPAVGGVMIMVRKSVIGDSVMSAPVVLDPGRCLAIRFGSPLATMFICIHVLPKYTIANKKALLNKVHALADINSHCTFLAGDFNFIGTSDSRYTAALTHEASDDDPVAVHFESIFHAFTEIHQGQFTRKELRNQKIFGMARLDRIYCDIRPGDLQDLRPVAATTHILTDPTFPSDHVPVRAVLAPAYAQPPTTPRIPTWVTDHFEYEAHTHTALLDSGINNNGIASLNDVVDILHAAARNIMRTTATCDPKSIHIQLHWATVLLRGHRSGDRAACGRAINAYPSLAKHISANRLILHESFHELLAELTMKDTSDMLDSINADPEQAAWRKVGVREALRRRAAAWAPKRKITSAFAVLDASGTAAADHQQAARLLRQHWQPAFDPPSTTEQAQKALLEYSAAAPSGFDWTFSDDDFDNALFHFRDSAPGPDGLPYSAWARAHPDITAIVRKAFHDFIGGGELPDTFNASNMVFLPKGELEADYVQVQRPPEATRPITLSNTIAKLFAKILNGKLSQLACVTVHGNQRGFVQGRRMQDNIIEAESLAIHLCKYFASQSGIVMFDFASAFPSLAHSYIFASLRKLGVPQHVLTALRKLYSRCTANILIGGSSDIDISILAGIKQGCPASGSIFALALDPFIRYLCLRIPPPLNAVGAFADDIVITVHNLLASLRVLFPMFVVLELAGGLKLNITKTIIIPLAKATEFSVRRFLVEAIPSWGKLAIKDAGKLLGVLLGPAAADDRWTAAAAKYWTRSREAKATTGGFMQALVHYRVFAAPVLQHLLSYTNIPKGTLHMENLALQGLTHGPFNTFPSGTVSSLADLGFPLEAPRLATTNTAALARTALTSSAFAAARNRYYSDSLPDEALLHPRVVTWLADTSFMALLTAYDTVCGIPSCITDIPAQHIQAHIASILRRRILPGPWPAVILRRLQRWIPGALAADAQCTIENIKVMSVKRPPAMVFDFVRVLLNGVTTDARMQGGMPHVFCVVGLGETA